MPDRLLADLLLLVHGLFILYVLLGGLLGLRHRGWLVPHLPAAVWGVWIEWSGHICPLTPLENRFRLQAGEQDYQGGFVEHYLLPVIYPAGLDRDWQWLLGGLALLINLVIYAVVFARSRRKVEATAGRPL
ncbi:MAG: DUF2784 domain-containing protein [Desulfuromonadales bacterium]|nr:DUF2784 domain-containing protein [Desulfuromonadales bacterium]